MKKIKYITLLLLTFLILFQTSEMKPVQASSPHIQYLGSASYGVYRVGMFLVDGEIAFCIDHYKLTPPTGTSYQSGQIYNNESVRAILYYGAGGKEPIVGTNNAGIVATSLALDSVVNGNHTEGRNSVPGYKELMAHARAKDAPDKETSFSKYSVKSSVSGNRQRSETIKFNADPKNAINIPVPQNVTLHIVGGGSYTNRTVKIQGGQSFYFSAGLDYDRTVSFNNLKPTLGKFQPIVFIPNSSSYQRLGQGWDQDPSSMKTLSVQFEKRQRDITVYHRDIYNNDLLDTDKYTRNIGSSYSFSPKSQIIKNGNTYTPVSSDSKTGTVGNSNITLTFYYNLQRDITVQHIDARDGTLLAMENYTKSRGDSYSFSPRTDLKKGEYTYRPVDPAKKTGTVGSSNIIIKFYYDVPLIKTGLERIQIYTAPADEGLPVKINLSKENIYDESVADMAKAKINLNLYQGSSLIISKQYTAKTLPKSLDLTIPSNRLTVNTHKPYTVKLEGYNKNDIDVIKNADALTTDGYTSAEQTIYNDATSNISYQGVVMTEREVNKDMKVYYETINVTPKKLDRMKTGYGFEMPIEIIYENDIDNSGTNFSFTMNVPEQLVDKSYLSYPVSNNKATVQLERTDYQTTKIGEKRSTTQQFELPHVNVEKRTGHLFSDQQVQANDSRIEYELIDGYRRFYLPIWGRIGDYPITVESKDIGINKMNIDITQNLNVFAHFYTHMDSETIADDAILLEPINKDNPFPNGIPDNWTSEQVEALEAMLNRELDKGNLTMPEIFSNLFK